jgi:adenylosuccinate synthase
MAVIILLGAQWGDEGKGKITDHLTRDAAVVARWNGGDNAGHTVVWGGQTFKFHLLPSGILYEHATCIIGNGVVVNPKTLLGELDNLKARGLPTARLIISGGAHLIMPYHIALDGASESSRGERKIGTTKRGIGPTYADKAWRAGIRAVEMLDLDHFARRVREQAESRNIWLTQVYGQEPLDVPAIVEEYTEYARRLAPMVGDASLVINEAIAAGKTVLCEGAQGTLLDLDHGTYPFVTSSSPIAGGACVGLGFGPKLVDEIIGVAKAYTTRVGAGPMPTELHDAVGDHLVEVGHEYGTTTGRRRRAGWLDLVILRYAARINGLTQFAMTKLDVLTGLDPVRVCVAYEYRGQRLEHFPMDSRVLEECRPIYEDLPGWDEDISAAQRLEELPAAARRYVQRVEELTGVPVTMISVGPAREQLIWRRPAH